jgi:hypothetical protein
MADKTGYIGRNPNDSAVTVARQTFTPTGVTTDFTFASGYTPGYFDIFVNGVKMIEGSDFTSTDGSTFSILNGGATNGDVIEGVAYKAFNAATATVGISSAGTPISTQANTLNFIGTGNTFALNGTTVDISISAAGAGGTWTNYDSNAGVSTTKKVKIENDLEVTGVTTSTGGFVGNVTGNATGLTGSPSITVTNINAADITASGTLTYEDVTNVDSVGIVTARSGLRVVGGGLTVTGVSTFFSKTRLLNDVEFHVGTNGSSGDYKFYRDSSNTRNIIYEDVSGAEARFISNIGGDSNAAFHFFKGSDALARFSVNSTQLYSGGAPRFDTTGGGISVTGTSTCTGSVQVGSGQSFGSSGASAAVYYGDGSNLTGIAVGLNTAAASVSGIVTTLDLSSAQDHKLTVSGISTITVKGGTEGDSHTVRIINSGITTVGFSTFFLFPSGADPSMPTADGAISLISFTVNRVGAGGTQLLAGAALNYS